MNAASILLEYCYGTELWYMSLRLRPLKTVAQFLKWKPGERIGDDSFVCHTNLKEVSIKSLQQELVCLAPRFGIP